MRQTLFIISDLHLGGQAAEGDQPGFQMCGPPGQKRLAEFIGFVGQQGSAGQPAHLIINGDVVDFLAERPFSAFTSGDEDARKKLVQAMGHAEPVFTALRAYVGGGGRLTLLCGNHDLELCLPGPRRELLDRLGEGKVEFLYDNQALAIGPVLIEHGNRYDGWNIVDHDALRALRSALSRREAPLEFPAPAGSRLVVEVMNEIKRDYPFIDLLKPENEAAIPLLAVLAPEHIDKITRLVDLNKKLAIWRSSRQAPFDSDGIPTNRGNISATMKAERSPPAKAASGLLSAPLAGAGAGAGGMAAGRRDPSDEALALARELAGRRPPTGDIGATTTKVLGFLDSWRGKRAETDIEKIKHLYRALRRFAELEPRFLRTDWEAETYLKPARATARHGYKVVVYGHTHLLKQVPLGEDATYINTGTWADLMLLPDEVLGSDEDAAFTSLYAFADDLVENRLEKWRGRVPSYARVEVGEGDHAGAGLYVFRGPERQDLVGPAALRGLL